LLHGVDDAPGHGRDIGFAVTADFRLVVNTAERNADILRPMARAMDFATDGFPDAGRADQTMICPLYPATIYARRAFR
jgi:hypothetical protein